MSRYTGLKTNGNIFSKNRKWNIVENKDYYFKLIILGGIVVLINCFRNSTHAIYPNIEILSRKISCHIY